MLTSGRGFSVTQRHRWPFHPDVTLSSRLCDPGSMSSPEPKARRPHVVVVGAGISGLATAHALGTVSAAPRVSVLESSRVIGGKLRSADVAGVAVDVGAEALLNRRPEAVDLARAVGLADAVEHPATSTAWLWSRGRMRPLPPTVMGIPADIRGLHASRAISVPALARAALEPALPGRRVEGDVAIGTLVAARFGGEVRDRLVEPVLGGVYAGRADELSMRACVPQLSAALDEGRSLLLTAAKLRGASRTDIPVFAGVAGGVGQLPSAVAVASGADVRTQSSVRSLERLPEGRWRLVIGPVPDPQALEADAVVLAVPASAAARLLKTACAAAAADLARIEHASVAIVTLAYDAAALPAGLRGSGFLVPPSEHRLVKACTYSTNKWAWLRRTAGGNVIVRCSVGRNRDVADLQRADAELVALAAADLADATGVAGRPLDAVVTRWGGALPQYAVGHVERVARIRAAVAELPGLAVCGAAYDGVGVAACIASAQRAAAAVLRSLADRETMQP
jgi:oxygen-dependent protoporphyrinogen oxidase